MAARRILLIALGFCCLAIGLVGIIIPVLPTTPFALLAAGCFARSSPRFLAALERSRLFGPFIENYRYGTGISMTRKVFTITILWTGLIISMALVQRTWITVLLAVIGCAVTVHLLLIKTSPGSRRAADRGLDTQPSVALDRRQKRASFGRVAR